MYVYSVKLLSYNLVFTIGMPMVTFMKGTTRDGQRHGHGIYRQGQITSTEASVYIGEWVMDKKQGYGVMDDIMKGMVLQKTRYISVTQIYCIQILICPVLF